VGAYPGTVLSGHEFSVANLHLDAFSSTHPRPGEGPSTLFGFVLCILRSTADKTFSALSSMLSASV
jgi:hypothetical protein